MMEQGNAKLRVQFESELILILPRHFLAQGLLQSP